MSIKENLDRVRESLDRAVEKAGRKAGEVELMAVSKTKPLELIRQAYDAGQRVFGENRVLEAEEKFASLPRDVRVELIGHLQTNKVKTAVSVFTCIQTVDSARLAEKLNNRGTAEEKMMDILLQLKTSEEYSKTGFENFDLMKKAVDTILGFSGLKIRGLMTIAPFSRDEKIVRQAFSECRDTRDRLISLYPELELPILSMGMSGDYEWAVLEGSTQVRVGSAIFGDRY